MLNAFCAPIILSWTEYFYRWVLSESIIGSNPGVGVRPSTSDLNIGSSIYLLNSRETDKNPSNDKGEGEKNIDYARRMKLYMKAYENNTGLVKCDGSDVRFYIFAPFFALNYHF